MMLSLKLRGLLVGGNTLAYEQPGKPFIGGWLRREPQTRHWQISRASRFTGRPAQDWRDCEVEDNGQGRMTITTAPMPFQARADPARLRRLHDDKTAP